MCLIIFAHQANPQLPLVLAANRDEFFSRPTQQASYWNSSNSSSQVLAGKDLQAGGTWLGVSRSGRFSAVTNVRDPSQVEQAARSRGSLTLEFLEGAMSATEYAETLANEFDQYAGYNLLLGDGNDMVYVNNLEAIVKNLEPGVYGLSNGFLNSNWPKVNRGRDELTSLMQEPNSIATDQLIEMMQHREISSDDQLPSTGVALELERVLSSTFIMNGDRGYGTLCSTAIIATATGEFRFSEQNYDASGKRTERHFYQFNKLD